MTKTNKIRGEKKKGPNGANKYLQVLKINVQVRKQEGEKGTGSWWLTNGTYSDLQKYQEGGKETNLENISHHHLQVTAGGGKDIEEAEHSSIPGGSANWYSLYGNQWNSQPDNWESIYLKAQLYCYWALHPTTNKLDLLSS